MTSRENDLLSQISIWRILKRLTREHSGEALQQGEALQPTNVV